MTKIKFTLSKSRQAADEIRRYARELQQKQALLVRKLVEKGVEFAKLEITRMDAKYTNELYDSIDGYYSEQANTGIIYAGAWYAVFVEFGTGIEGARKPHPTPEGWRYDVNNHGENGWWYWRDGDWHWTKGMQSRPFMFNTARELEDICTQIAAEVYKNG